MSDCHPVQHYLRNECFNWYLATQGVQSIRCPMCRQFVLGECEYLSLGTIFDFDCDDGIEFEDMPAAAQLCARAFQRGEVTARELNARAVALMPGLEELLAQI